jgi:hypothetical protein
LLPFLELYSQSRHTHKSQVGTLFLAIYQTITMMSPRFYDPLHAKSLTYVMGYLGITATLLCAFSISREKRLRHYALFFIVLVFLFYSKITAFRFINWIGTLPFMHFIYYTKYCSEFYLGVAILAGLGFHNIRHKNAHIAITYLLIVTYVLLYILLFERNLQKFPMALQRDQVRETFAWTLVFLIPGILIAMGALRFRNERLRAAFVWLIPLLLIAELYYYLPKHRAERYETETKPPYVKFLQGRIAAGVERVYGIDVALFPLNASVFQLQDVRNFSALEVERYWKYMKRFMTIPFIPTHKEIIFEDMFTGTQFPDIIYSRYFDLLGVKYAIGDYYLNIPAFHEHLINNCTILPATQENVVRGYRDGYYYIGVVTPAEIVYDAYIPADGDTLIFDTYIDGKEYWKLKGGVRFSIKLTCEGRETELFTRTMNPASRIADREWHAFNISLNSYAGKRVSFHFITDGDLATARSVKVLWRILYLKSWEKRLRTNFRLVYDSEVKIYENADAFPRAFFVSDATYLTNEDDLIRIMEADDFDPARHVLLEGSPPRDAASKHTISEEALTTQTTITRYEPSEIEISVKNNKPGYLVLSDSYYPGWRASVDGVEARVYRADYFLRTVFIKAPGKHLVRFRYAPRSVIFGFGISVVGLLAILVLFFLGKFRQKIIR